MFAGIHANQRISNDIFQEWTYVYLSQDEAKGIGIRVAEHYEFVPGQSFVEVKFVRRGTVVHKLLVPSRQLLNHIPQGENDTINKLGLFVEC